MSSINLTKYARDAINVYYNDGIINPIMSYAGNALTVANNEIINNNLTVLGNKNLTGNLTVSGASTLSGANVSGLTKSNTLAVTGNSTLSSTTISSANVSGALSVANTTVLNSTLNVSGNSTLAAINATSGALSGLLNAPTLSVSVQTSMNALSVSGNSIFNDVIISGTLIIDSVSTYGVGQSVSGNSTLANVTITGNETIGCNLSVANLTTFQNGVNVTGVNASIGCALTVSGVATLSNGLNVTAGAAITGNTNLNGILIVNSGLTTLNNGLNVANNSATTLTGSLGLTKAATLSNTLNVAGLATLASLSVTGNAAMNNGLTVSGATTSVAALSAGSSSLASLSVAGNSQMNALNVSGLATLNSGLSVTGSATLNSGLSLAGAATLNSSLSVLSGTAAMNSGFSLTGAATLNSGLSVAGNSSLASLAVSGNSSLAALAVSGNSALTGALSVGSSLSAASSVSLSQNLRVSGNMSSNSMIIAGNTNVDGDLVVNGNLTVNGCSTTLHTAELAIDDNIIVCGNGNFNSDILDLGLYGQYTNNVSGQSNYAGLKRVAGSTEFTLFQDQLVSGCNTYVQPVNGEYIDLVVSSNAPTNLQYVSITPVIASTPAAVLLTLPTPVQDPYYASVFSLDLDYADAAGGAGIYLDQYNNMFALYPNGQMWYINSSGVKVSQVMSQPDVTKLTKVLYYSGVGDYFGDTLDAGVSATPFGTVGPQITAISPFTYSPFTSLGNYLTSTSYTAPSLASFNVQTYQLIVSGLTAGDNKLWTWSLVGTDEVSPVAWHLMDSRSGVNVTGSPTFTCNGPFAASAFKYINLVIQNVGAYTAAETITISVNLLNGGNILSTTNSGTNGNNTLPISLINDTFTAEKTILSNMANTLQIAGKNFAYTMNSTYFTDGKINTASLDVKTLLANYLSSNIVADPSSTPAQRLHKQSTFFGDVNNMFCVKLLSNTVGSTITEGLPNKITYLGSNDNGTNWYNLSSQSQYVSGLMATTGSYASYGYKKYRIVLEGLSSSNVLSYCSWLLYSDYGSTIIPVTVSAVSAGLSSMLSSLVFNEVSSTANIHGLANLYNSAGAYIASVSTNENMLITSTVYGTMLAKTYDSPSDMNLKKNIVNLDGALDKLDNMRGVYHDWIDPRNTEKEIGVIAQEVQKVYPELVYMGGNGYLSVNYPKLTAVLIQATKELKKIILSLSK